MTPSRGPTVVRYWGSYFKSPEQARRIAGYFSALLEAGWRCHLVCCQPPSDDQWLAPFADGRIHLHYLPRARGNFDVQCMNRARQLSRDTGTDVLHCDNTHTSPLLGAWAAGVPVRLWTKHAMQPAYEDLRAPTLRDRLAPAVRASATVATMVLPISRVMGAELVGLGLPPHKVRVMPLPVMSAATIAREPARSRFGCSSDDVVFGTIGRAAPVKGWDVLLKAFADVAARLPQARLLLVGSVSSSEERAFRVTLDAIVTARGLGSSVAWTGHLTDIGPALAAMDAFVLPSRSEGFSLALLEALTAGLPVISTRVGIAPDVVVDGTNGLLVERDDARDLADAMTRVGADSIFRERLRTGAANPLPGIPSPDEHARALLELYESLLSEPRSAREA